MKILIIRCIAAYIFTLICMLVTLLCNPYLKMGRINNKTGEFEASSKLFKIIFAVFWFITIPMYFRARKNIS